MSKSSLTVKAGFDRRLIALGRRSVRHMAVTVTPPDRPVKKNEPKVGRNIALVIDASGSMTGEKLESAKEAAERVVEQLSESDILTVVSFASDVITHVDAQRMDQAGRRAAIRAIRALRPRGSTNLAGGWLEGAKTVALAAAGGQKLSNHVVLLTDGMANQGVTDPAVLGRRAAKLLEQGISSSTVGIGEDYSPDQIEAIGIEGGGGFDHASVPEEIVEVVLGHLQMVSSITAENVRLRLALPPGVDVECLSRFPSRASDGALEVLLGGIPAGVPRVVVFRLKMPAGRAGERLDFAVLAEWCRPGEVAGVVSEPAELHVQYATDVALEPRDDALSAMVAEAWRSYILLRTTALNREQRYDEAEEFVDEQLRYFRCYCEGLAGGPALVAKVERLKRNARRDWGVDARLQLSAMMSRASRSEVAYRASSRSAVAEDFLPED
jgi:Ca-activated chloride channel homolog